MSGVRALGAWLRDRIGFLVGRPLFWVALTLFIMAWPIARTLRLTVPAPPPVLGAMPEFALTDQHGRAYGSADLHGRVWVLDVLSPESTPAMAKVQHRARNLGTSFHLVSFAPLHTPKALAAYTQGRRVSPRMWSFLAGDAAAVVEALTKTRPSAPSGVELVLVDRKMRIRGFYRGSEKAELDSLLADAGLVANEQ
jgi:protein SCO1/2